MRILCPYKCVAWGDCICNIWAAEYVSKHVPDAEIFLEDTYSEGRFRTWNKLDWVTELVSEVTPEIIKQCDYVLCTHHRHALVEYNEPLKRIFFDAHGIIPKFVMEGWYPTFQPTKNIAKLYDLLKLPQDYISVHYSPCCFGTRNKYTWEEFLDKYKWIWTQKELPVVSTGTPIEGCINLSNIQGVLKLYVMQRSVKLYGTQSGFNSIASMYKNRENTFLIDTDLKRVLEKAPPSVAFGNCKPLGDLKKVYYYLDKRDFSNYYNDCRILDEFRWSANTRTLYPWFTIPDVEPPEDYQYEVNLGIENAPRPANFDIRFEEAND